jgi:branched-chain amino acid aminotransferase
MEKTELIWMNGEMVPWDEANVHILTHALHYGTGVFEGIRCYATDRGPAIFRLTDHIRRLHGSAKIHLMNVPYSVGDLVEASKDVVRENGMDACYIRPIIWLGFGEIGLNPLNCEVHAAIACWPWGAYLGEESFAKGVRAKVSSFRRLEPNMIPPAAKASGQYLNSILAKVEAVKAGYDEAILLNTWGMVTDGSGENVFVVKDRVLHTPPISAGPLPGITRASVIEIGRDLGYEVAEDNLVRSDLYLADEVFFTGTAAELVPVCEIDDRQVGEGGRGPLTKELQDRFFDVAHGRVSKYEQWNEHVK